MKMISGPRYKKNYPNISTIDALSVLRDLPSPSLIWLDPARKFLRLSRITVIHHPSEQIFAMFTFNSLEALTQKASDLNCDIGDAAFAIGMDKLDPLSALRDDFMVPKASEIPTTDCSKLEDGEADCIYLCGNSLGLMPKKAQEYVQEDMEKWGKMGVHGKVKHAVDSLPQAHARVSGIRSMPTRKNKLHGRYCQQNHAVKAVQVF
jgi:hypothetical protein